MMMGVHSVLPQSVIPAHVVSRQFDHAAGLRYWGAVQSRSPRWEYGLAGLGQDTTDLTTVDASGNILDVNGNVLGNVNTTPVFTTTLPTGQTVAAPSTAQLLTALSTAGIDIAKLAIIQPGTAQAGGSIVRQQPGIAVQPIATNTQTGINVGANVSTGAAVAGSTVAIVGLGLIALLMLGGGGRRGH